MDRVIRKRLADALGSERAVSLRDASTSTADIGTILSPSAAVPTEDVIATLRKKVRAAVKLHFADDCVTHAHEFAEKMDVEAGDIFSILMHVFMPLSGASKWTWVRTAVLLEQGLHMFDAKHSETEWSLSDFFYLHGLSEREREMLHHMGFGTHPSHQQERVAKMLAEADERVSRLLDDDSVVLMCIFDGFNVHARASVLRDVLSMSRTADLTNIILKNVGKSGLNLRVTKIRRPLLPRAWSYELARPWLERMWRECNLARPYVEVRSEQLAAFSRVLRPYDGTFQRPEGSAVTLPNVTLFKCLPEKLATADGEKRVLQAIAQAFGPSYWRRSLMFFTGDWHAYIDTLEAVRCDPEVFGRVLFI